MGRPKDGRYWDQVMKEVNGMLKCKRCGHKFKGGVSRIKAHVDRKQGQGIRPCSIDLGSVPCNEVGDNNIAVDSSNPQPQGVVNAANSLQVTGAAHEMIDANFGGLWNHPNGSEFSNLLEGCPIPGGYAMMGSGNSGVEGEINDLKQSVHDLTCEEDDIKEQLQLMKCSGKKRKIQVDYWLKKVRELKQKAWGVVELVGQGGLTRFSGLEIQRLTKQVRTCKEGKPLVLSNELVGIRFEKNIKEVWELLRDHKVFKIGIHGMGGVGKTCLVTHISDQIKRKGTFNFKNVFWVTLSQDFSVFELQNAIAKRVGVKLDEDDQRMRAEILSSELVKKENSLFILDNVWKYIDLQKVGIPLRVKGNKLILTSRLRHVCRQMDCHIIGMQPLLYLRATDIDHRDEDRDENWALFLLKLGFHGTPSTFPPKVLKTARSVAGKCEGLPLGISVMARTMKGVNDIHCWRHALNKLQNSKMGEEMEEEVFKILKLSYDNLIDINMQKCFLYCALFDNFARKDMIMNLFEEGLINGMRSLEEIFDEGRAILDKLVDHSLLLEVEGDVTVRLSMHGLMRDIACHNILEERGRYMVKCGKGLEKIPDMQEWTANLEKVSLMSNMITEIPTGTSPECPKLSTLIFSDNLFSSIPDSFFNHINALAILDLSNNRHLTSLPDSVANFRSLISLLLKGCYKLKNVPPLVQLQKLSRLVISGTSIKELPQGLEMLINLNWLDLSGNSDLTFLPEFVLPNLTNMQYLDIRSSRVKVKVADVQGMSMLEYFGGCFHDCNDYYDYVRKIVANGCGPKTYHIHLGIFMYLVAPVVDIEEQTQNVSFGNCEELAHLLPSGLTKLKIMQNEQWRCLCNALSFKFDGPSSLSDIIIDYCAKLESLFCLSASCSICTLLQNRQYFPPHGVFYSLKSLCVSRCNKMEKLLTLGPLKQLQNLESLSVSCCHSMKQIIAVRSDEDDDDDSTITLPKLTRLQLHDLPELKTVCRGIMKCGSSGVLDILACPCLEWPTIQVFCDSVSNSDFDEEAY